MTLALWLGDEVGIQKQHHRTEGLYSLVVKENFDRYYTKYGFVYPLEKHDINYEAVVENRLPKIPVGVESAFSPFAWMLIDHHGSVWQVDYFIEDELRKQTPKMSIWAIPAGKVDSIVVCGRESENQHLTGFVHVTRDKEKINDFIIRQLIGNSNRLHWFSKEAIVKELHRRYPLDENSVENM